MRVVDAEWDDGIAWGPALEGHERATRQLLKGFDRQVRASLDQVPWPLGGAIDTLMRKGARALHSVLGEHFGAEVDEFAELAGVEAEDLLLANLSYDLSNTVGCSTFVAAGQAGPLHARTMDWPFPGKLLRTHTTAIRVRGAPAGDYAMVGWPGFFGALTGVAPGRFSVTVNYVVHASESGVIPALKRAVTGGWPVPWAVRIALDDCKTFKSAVRFLSEVSLLSPVLFTVAGTRAGEAVTIERGPDDYLQRGRDDGTALTTNHYVTEEFDPENVDLEETSSLERFEQLDRRLRKSPSMTPAEALKALSTGWVDDVNTQHRVVMSAAEQLLRIQVPGQRTVSVPLGG